jgi:formate hydrogenlyase transcriptional activator
MRNAKHRAFTPPRLDVMPRATLATSGRNRSLSYFAGPAIICGALHMSTKAELQPRNERFELLLNLTSSITSSLDLREVMRSIAANIREVIHADAAAVSLPDAATGRYRVFAMDFPHGKGVIKEELFFTPSAAGKRAMDTLQPVVVNMREQKDLGPHAYNIAAAEGIEALCCIPLVNRGRGLGLMWICRTTETPFSPEDVDFLSRASGQIAIAVENALAFQEVSGLGDRLQLLLNLTARITSSLDRREVLRAIAANIREVIHADGVTVSLLDAATGKCRILAADIPHGKGIIKEELYFTPSAAGRKAMDTLQPVVMDTRERGECAIGISETAATEGVKAHCIIPLVNRGGILGFLSILRTTDTPFTSEDVDFLSRASGQIAIAIENALAYKEISELKDKLAQEKVYLEEEFRSEMGFEQIIGNSAALKHVLQLVETVAPSDSTVLLLGETGTGKELIARAIHDRSRRNQRTLVKLNCAAIPTGLLESELFGHEKGAFTGAINQKIGRLELADQGTLFLDEVGDIPTEIQPKLLRALQEQEFERLGSTHTRKVNVRLVAATNRDLDKMVANKEFRSDLYYRLNVFPIRIPPLRDRREDIPLLVSYFVQKYAKRMQKCIETVPAAVMKGLTNLEWPGNIRELENFMERAVLLTRGRSLEAPLADLRKTSKEDSLDIRHQVKQIANERTDSRSDKASVVGEYARKQRQEIVQALTTCKGRVGGADGAAARLGMNRTTLLSRMKKFGIFAKQYS